MAVDNIDLSGEIKAWKDAAYGKDVRAANVAAFEKIQGTVNDTVQNVNQASKDASSASQNAQKAVDDIQSAIETATSKASEAAGSATAADTSKKAAASSAAAADTSKAQAAASAAEAKKIAQGLGDFDGTAAKVKTTDTYGLVVSALGESTAQALIDAIANKVMNELINKNKIVNNLLATDASTVLAGTQGTALDKRLVAAENAVTQLNSDLINTPQTPDIKAFCKSLSERQASCFLAQGSTYTGAQPDSTQQWVYEPGIAIRRWDVVYILWFSGTRNLAIGTYDVKTDTLTWNVK